MPKPNNEALEQEIKTLIAGIVEIEEDKITSEASFVDDLGMDSMMALEILAALEKRYKIKIPEENLIKMTDLKKVIRIINQIGA